MTFLKAFFRSQRRLSSIPINKHLTGITKTPHFYEQPHSIYQKSQTQKSFDWIKDRSTRYYVKNMYQAANELHLMNWLKTQTSPRHVVGWSHENISKLSNHPLVEKCGHSGYTFSVTFRIVQSIAKNG